MVKLKSKKIMFVVLMGIIAFIASLLICFGQNAYADEDYGSDDRAGYIVFNPKTSSEEQEDFTNIHELIDKCNKKHVNAVYIIVNFEKDINFEDCLFHVWQGRTITFNLGNHKMYNVYPSENTFFWVAGTLYLKGDSNQHGIIEGAHGTTNASIISDRGQINASNIDFVNDVTKDDSYPKYASHLYFANTTGASTFENCNFSGGKAEYGGSVFVRDSADTKCCISFNSCDFNKCRADYQGGAIYNKANNSCLGLDHTTISECHSHNDGGAILMNGSNQQYDFKYMTIDNCYSEVSKGGAIYSDSEKSIIDFDHSTISNCSSQDDGGAIATVAKHEYVTLNNSTIDKCKSNNGDGGAIITEGDESDTTFNYSTINECKSNGDGGAIITEGKKSHTTFNYSTINECKSNGDGGAIITAGDESNTTFSNSTINGCSAHHGGAIYNTSIKCDYRFNYTDITKCESTAEGGAIYSNKDYENYYFDNSNIKSCKAENDGGAIFLYSSHVKITGTQCNTRPSCLNYKGQLFNTSTFLSCSSDVCGGAIYGSNVTGCGNDVDIEGLNFVANYSSDEGGAICLNGTDAKIYRCCFDSNIAKKQSGGLYVCSRRLGYINENEFFNNHCESSDGANQAAYNFRPGDDPHPEIEKLILNNKIYYLGKYNYNDEFHLWNSRSHTIAIQIKDYKIHGNCSSMSSVGPVEIRPLANLTVEFLDENDRIIGKTKTDMIGNYEASLDFASIVKVRVLYPFSVKGSITSNLIDMHEDHEFNACFD